MAGFLVAAAHKSSGKTIISTGLASALTKSGCKVQTFKKGPDYIDPMWLSAASGGPCYNLDFNVMEPEELLGFYASRAIKGDISLIETNKGLFDGVKLDGGDSNAALAKLLQSPVVLVIDSSGMTRGIAPLLQGYAAFDQGVTIAGVILNNVGGLRHENKLRAAVETYTDIPVLGAVGRNPLLEIGERHLGLTTPVESREAALRIDSIGEIIKQSVDLTAVQAIANTAVRMPIRTIRAPTAKGSRVRIGFAKDQAFGFYYADDLEAFAENGAELIPFDTLNDTALPEIDGLFLGGGFPETQLQQLAANAGLMRDIWVKIEQGMPTYAECGGLMYLCETLSWQGQKYQMVGVISGDAVMHDRPQGRGYSEFENTSDHPWSAKGAYIKAHEFHYARVENLPSNLKYGRKIMRGEGLDGHHDAVVLGNLVAGFCHMRSSKSTPWVKEFVQFVRKQKAGSRNPSINGT